MIGEEQRRKKNTSKARYIQTHTYTYNRLTVWIQYDKITHTTCIKIHFILIVPSKQRSDYTLFMWANLVFNWCEFGLIFHVIRASIFCSPTNLPPSLVSVFAIPIITTMPKFLIQLMPIFFSVPPSSNSMSILKMLSSLFYRWYHSKVVT